MGNLKSGSHRFANTYGEELCKLLFRAQTMQAAGELKPRPEKDGSSVTVWREGIWRYSDHRQGKQPFSGTIAVWRDGTICFTMQYRGRIQPYVQNKVKVEDCLAEALARPCPHTPWRGPNKHRATNGLVYTNIWTGSLQKGFRGTETIVSPRKMEEILYEVSYMGGIVNED